MLCAALRDASRALRDASHALRIAWLLLRCKRWWFCIPSYISASDMSVRCLSLLFITISSFSVTHKHLCICFFFHHLITTLLNYLLLTAHFQLQHNLTCYPILKFSTRADVPSASTSAPLEDEVAAWEMFRVSLLAFLIISLSVLFPPSFIPLSILYNFEL